MDSVPMDCSLSGSCVLRGQLAANVKDYNTLARSLDDILARLSSMRDRIIKMIVVHCPSCSALSKISRAGLQLLLNVKPMPLLAWLLFRISLRVLSYFFTASALRLYGIVILMRPHALA